MFSLYNDVLFEGRIDGHHMDAHKGYICFLISEMSLIETASPHLTLYVSIPALDMLTLCFGGKSYHGGKPFVSINSSKLFSKYST